jgi:two-component system sensor histidine kinase/response regulator
VNFDLTQLPQLREVPPLPTRKRLILIVDDLPENLQVLAGHLTEQGYEILAATNGARALALVRNRKPDLILLDIMMPEMDGFAVCTALKEDEHSADIPVIFITARSDTEDILRGFELGAVDYVTKPFRPPELLARVRTHIELKSSRDLFSTYNKQLERISKHLRRLNEDKNRFLSIVSHDIRGAFGNVISVSRLLTDHQPIDQDDAAQLLTDIGIEAEHMIALAENLLNIDAIERREVRLQSEIVETQPLLDFAIQAHQMASQAKNIRFLLHCDGTAIRGDLTACRQLLSNLVSNAVKYSSPGSRVWIDVLRDGDGFVRLSVRDEGSGISTEDQKKLFKPFTRLSRQGENIEHSIGLGLSIVRLMAEGMGGTAGCESQPGNGATFFARLPAA